ncbi:exocyst complex component 3 [Nematocida homosporus]|uniref:exocyst complex component 3 n=1 Tax=Nematocida homosporus TaxID=1912981 RepID=UPI00221EFCDE|nr:exocyst complex component 3 [Nematocida homosporus]KAI5185982.1 exocyst complex component 3 [Nematocida homosporus]
MAKETLTALATEIEAIQAALKDAKISLSTAKEDLDGLHLKVSSLPPLKHADLVRSSSTAQTNLERTRDLLTKIKSFDSVYDKLHKQIRTATDSKSSRYLLSIHSALKELTGLRENLPSISEKVATLNEAFNILLFTLVDSLPEVIKKDTVTAYLKITKIIDYEDSHTHTHRERLFETFLESIERQFREIPTSESAVLSYTSFEFITQHVTLLKPTETLNLPDRYKIFSFAAIHYHRALYEFLDAHSDSFDPNESIAILLWTQTYYDQMRQLGKSKGSLGPVLFAGKEAFLINRYIQVAKEKLSSWIANLAQMECTRFAERKKAPDLDSTNKFISIGFMDLHHIIKRQLEPISTHPEIFNSIAQHILLAIQDFKTALIATIQSELALVLEDKAKSGFEEYCIAIGNSGLKFMDCLHTLSFYTDPTIQKIGQAFYDCFLFTIQALIKNVSFVLKPASQHLFTKSWAAEPVAATFIATFKDYLADYQETMISYAFSQFTSALISTITHTYLDRLAKKHAYFPKEYLAILSADKKELYHFFSPYLSKDALKNNFLLFDFVIRIASTDNLSLCISEVKTFHKTFPKEPKSTLKTILKKMPGGSKDFASEVLKRADIN